MSKGLHFDAFVFFGSLFTMAACGGQDSSVDSSQAGTLGNPDGGPPSQSGSTSSGGAASSSGSASSSSSGSGSSTSSSGAASSSSSSSGGVSGSSTSSGGTNDLCCFNNVRFDCPDEASCLGGFSVSDCTSACNGGFACIQACLERLGQTTGPTSACTKTTKSCF